MAAQPTSDYQPAGFFRRIGALIYDLLIVFAIAMLAAGFVMLGFLIATQLGVSLDPYLDASDFLSNHPIASPLYTFYLVAVIAGFYCYFWCRAGQTVGMKTWRLRLQNLDGSLITVTQALIRLATACLGLGNLLVLFDTNSRAFQDHFAKCDMVVLPKPPKRNKKDK